jgi:hypothetical protein
MRNPMDAQKDKRKLPNLRRVIDQAPPIEKATLRALARQLKVEQLLPIDATLGRLMGGKKTGENRG